MVVLGAVGAVGVLVVAVGADRLAVGSGGRGGLVLGVVAVLVAVLVALVNIHKKTIGG